MGIKYTVSAKAFVGRKWPDTEYPLVEMLLMNSSNDEMKSVLCASPQDAADQFDEMKKSGWEFVSMANEKEAK